MPANHCWCIGYPVGINQTPFVNFRFTTSSIEKQCKKADYADQDRKYALNQFSVMFDDRMLPLNFFYYLY